MSTVPLRSANIFQTLLVALSLPMALVVPLWIVAGRVLFGAGGDLVRIFAVTLGPVLFVLLLLTAVKGLARPFAPKTSVFLLLAYLAGGAFGFTVPDFGAGGSASVMSRLLGESALGMSAALCNPFGIATLFFSIGALVLASRNRTDSHQL